MSAVRKSVPFLIAFVAFAALTAFVLFRPGTQTDDESRIDPVPLKNRKPVNFNAREDTSIQSPIRFTLMPPSDTGIDFEYYGNPSDQHDMIEQNGGGVAIFDYDGDGQAELFLANGSHFLKPAEQAAASHRLYRATGAFRFQDATVPAGLTAFGFGQGCAAADYDNDGFCDLFVANYGINRLWHNNGDGTFSETTQNAGVGDRRWSSSAAFADLDGDGNLDLYVVNYVDWTPDRGTAKRIPSPMDFNGVPDLLYRNAGDGTFEELGVQAGISIAGEGKGLAVAIGDLNDDRLPDIYVANDTARNFLFRNLGGLRFEETGVPSGVAVSQDGSIGSSMGIGLCDYDGDGSTDLFVTNFAQEVVDAFTSIGGSAGFIANNSELGIDRASRNALNFGIVTADFDLDLWPDLFFANGHLWDETASGGEYKMRPTLLRNSEGERFIDVSTVGGDYFKQQWLGRAVAQGDLDRDGDTDLVVSHLLDPPAILRNDSDRAGRSIRVQFIGTRSSRQPLGSRVEVTFENGRRLVTNVPSGGSFQVTHDPVLIIPIGKSGGIAAIQICWSNGSTATWHQIPADETLRLIESRGTTD